MMSFLTTLLSFIVAISILVAIHEYGHFIVAKKLGVKILRFSIGFGKPIWIKRFGVDQTEFCIARWPLGGYVKMLDRRETEVDEKEQQREFTSQPVWKRFAIVAAGPIFNFLFAIVAYWLMFVIGVSGIKPVIGNVEDGSVAARAGLKAGYEIVAINQHPTPIWDVAVQDLIAAVVDRSQAKIELVDNQGRKLTRSLDFSSQTGEIKVEQLFKQLGMKPWRPHVAPVVGTVVENSPAARAGFKKDDIIVSIQHKKVNDWVEVVETVTAKPAQTLEIEVLRQGRAVLLKVTPDKISYKGKEIGRIGLAAKAIAPYPEEMKVMHRYGFTEAFPVAMGKTADYTALTLKMLGRIFTGEMSIKSLSGPVSIARYAGYSASAGLARFLDFLALVSISLGILNLLPVPVLDGGHLVFYIIEIIRRKPLSDETQETASQVGLVLLFSLMAVALYNDLVRVFG